MKAIFLDIETYSNLDIKKFGIYKHIESSVFDINAVAYLTEDMMEPEILEITRQEDIPNNILDAIIDEQIIKYSGNSEYIRVCFEKWLGISISPNGWRSLSSLTGYLGMPRNISNLGVIVKKGNLYKEQKELRKFFGHPYYCGGIAKRIFPTEYPSRWKKLLDCMKQNLIITRDIINELTGYFQDDSIIWKIEEIKTEIRKKGIKVDTEALYAKSKQEYKNSIDTIVEICKKLKINSVEDLNNIAKSPGFYTDMLNENVCNDLKAVKNFKEQIDVCTLDKYSILKRHICQDKKIRGMHTGKNDEKEMMRELFIPDVNKTFITCNYKWLDLCIMAWLADEEWLLKELCYPDKLEAKLLKKMNVCVDADESQLCKRIYEMCLFNGKDVYIPYSCDFEATDGIDIGLIEDNWRILHSKIVEFRNRIQRAFYYAILYHTDVQVEKIRVCWEHEGICVLLPSGRKIVYADPRIERSEKEIISFSYLSCKGNTCRRVWEGGAQICKNIVEKISSDLMNAFMLRLKQKDYNIVLKSYKNIIMEEDINSDANKEIYRLLQEKPSWAMGLPLCENVEYIK